MMLKIPQNVDKFILARHVVIFGRVTIQSSQSGLLLKHPSICEHLTGGIYTYIDQ